MTTKHPSSAFARELSALCTSSVAALAVSAVACLAPPATASAADGVDTPQWRPALHYSPQRNWMNDPNGLVYENGRYHLFYQHNPNDNFWGDMSWGHATSCDLVHWEEQPVAIRANEKEEVFSGSVVVDAHNTSGLGPAGSSPLVALYTSVYKPGSGHEPGVQAQSLAYSMDHGQTWHRYAHNPVLTLEPESRQFRDPKVTWYAPGGYWLMTAVVADAQVVKLYRSSDLIHWSFLSDFTLPDVPHRGALWEMPELLALPLDGNPHDVRWVMIVNVNPWSIAGGSGAMYFVGRFDGKTFKPDDVPPAGADPARYRWLDHGADFYAAGTFANTPGHAPVAIAWMSNWDYAARVPTAPWKGAMTVPRTLALRTIDGMPRLVSTIAEPFAASARDRPSIHLAPLGVSSGVRELPAATHATVQMLSLSIEPRDARRAGLIVRRSADGRVGTRIFYDTANKTLTVDRSASGLTAFAPTFSLEHIVHLPLEQGKLRLDIVVDKGSIEVFAGHGRVSVTDLIFPTDRDDRVAIFTEGGSAVFADIAVTNLERDARGLRKLARAPTAP